jgi:hypothetical protein
MKAAITFLSVILISLTLWAQSPQKMSYQAVVRDGSNNLVTSTAVGMRISILQGTPAGTEVYKELFSPDPQTNVNGLVTLEIGTGIPLTGTFASINWSNGPYYIKVETDPDGGTNYTITGTCQILSVPYSLYAKTAETFAEIDPKVGGNTVNYLSKWNGVCLITSTVFDDGNNVGIGTPSPGQRLDVSGGSVRTTNQFISTIASGTPPLTVNSGTAVANLNSDMVDGTHQAVHTEWLQILSLSTSVTLHTFVNSTLQTVGVSGRIRIKCTDGNGVDWVAYVNGVRSNGSLLNNGTKDFDLNGGNDDLKLIITSSVNNLHQGVVEIHQVNGEYMSGIVWDTFSSD